MSSLVTTLPQAVHAAQDAFDDVREHLQRQGERDAADQDVQHMAGTLGPLLAAAADRLATAGGRPPADDRGAGHAVAGALREKAAELARHRPSGGAALLADLRAFLGDCADAQVAVTVATVGATAAKELDLEQALGEAQTWCERTHRWALTRLKAAAPQVLNGP